VTPKVNALCSLILMGTFLIIGFSQLITKKRRFS
jgi:ABC-type spermidine/putrescine transport system permease subunit II